MRFLLCLVATASVGLSQTVRLSDAQALEIGRRIWKNECGGTVSGLTSWNAGEEFASLGIAFHLVSRVSAVHSKKAFPNSSRFWPSVARIPSWLEGTCPWRSRAAFVADFQSPRMTELRDLLKSTVAQQARFAALRLEEALPKILAAAAPSEREGIRVNFYRVAGERLGPYALMDYVNFKGEGVNPAERYRGQGWGLLQVLEAMPEEGPPLPGFVRAADQVLTRRVANSPPARNESRWLPGWRNRLETYMD
jgi:hypothetical protein